MKKITKLVFMVSVFIFCGASLAKEQVEKNTEDTQQETKFNDEATKDLFRAVKEENVLAVKQAIQRGASINARDRWGYTPLHYSWKPSVIKILLENDADPNAKNKVGLTLLHYCVFFQKTDAMAVLISYSADVNARNKWGDTPLHYCWEPAGIKILLKNGADVNPKNKCGRTPLYYRALYGQDDGVEVLIAHGADPNVTDENGVSLLNIVGQRGEYWKYYSVWMKHVRNHEPENRKRWSATTKLIMALRSGNATKVKQAIKSGAFTDYSFNDGTTLLDIARNHNFTASDEQTTDKKKVKKILLDACKKKQNNKQQEENILGNVAAAEAAN